MFKRSTLSLSLALACSTSVLSLQAHSAGFQLYEHSSSGLGRAYAGEAANIENSAVIYRNPAVMSRFDSMALAVSAIAVSPTIDLDGTSGFGPSVDDDVAHSGVVPNLSLIVPINSKLHAGLSVGSNFNTGVEFSESFQGTHFGQLAEINTVDTNLSFAYQLSQNLSLALGVSYIDGDGHVRNTLPSNHPTAGGATLFDLQGEGDAWTWNVGTLWQINPQHRLGFSYKHHVTLDLEGSARSDLDPTKNGSGNLPVELPAMMELASEHQLSERLALHFSANWTGWQRFETLTANIEGQSVEVKRENWKNTYRLALGSSYALSPQWQLSAGFAFDNGTVDDEYRTITIPDSDRLWYSLGLKYAPSTQHAIDLALTYIDFKEASIEEFDASTGDSFKGVATGNALLAGVQYSYRF